MYLISSSGDGHDDIDMKQNPVYGVPDVQTQFTGEETHYVTERTGLEQPHEYDYVATQPHQNTYIAAEPHQYTYIAAIHWNWSWDDVLCQMHWLVALL